jgi:Ca2+-binding RTX toxin-like protein
LHVSAYPLTQRCPVIHFSKTAGIPLAMVLKNGSRNMSALSNTLTQKLVYENLSDQVFGQSGNDPFDVGNPASLSLENGTISLSFSLDELFGEYALVSKDARYNNDGDFTVWVSNGVLKVSMQDGEDTEWLTVPMVLEEGETYQFAMSFGEDGLQLWVNGELRAAEPEFKADLTGNDNSLVIGGTRAWRSDQTDSAHNLFEGTIGDVMIFDEALEGTDMIALAGAVDMSLGHMAAHHAAMADLMPVFEQLHHGSDTLKDIMEDYGVSHHGHVMHAIDMTAGDADGNDIDGDATANAINGGMGQDTLHGRSGDDIVQGGSGNDVLMGGKGNDILDGGEGEDKLLGGLGNDLLISQADGREGAVAYDPDRDEGDPYNELTDGKLYPDQPVPGGDYMRGGEGADIFYFQTLINAKERFIEEHTRDDGTINWHGVAGENDNIHDHWVDVIGNDIVADFSRDEGDRLVIEGHTTEIRHITYGDSDGNGVMDHSVIWLYSDQGGGGGAHNQDELGTITVYGDLVLESDIEHTAAPAYGIVATIEDLALALAPEEVSEDIPMNAPTPLPEAEAAENGRKPVFAALGDFNFERDERAPLVFAHTDDMDVRNGTIAFSFRADSLDHTQWLFSKDASGNGLGHMVAYLEDDGDLVIRMQDQNDSYYFKIDSAVEIGETYDFALNFGKGGMELYLDGVKVAADKDIRFGLNWNEEAFIVGANGWSNTPGEVDRINSHFTGEINDVVIYNRQLDDEDLYGTEARDGVLYVNGSSYKYDVTQDGSGGLVVSHGGNDMAVGDAETIAFNNVSFRTQDIEFGTVGDDTLKGGATADLLKGEDGNDKLWGYGNDDSLDGGAGNDSLWGSEGRDLLVGGLGDDYLDGGDQSDQLYGGEGNDELKGGAGNDKFYGGFGDDTFYGEFWGDGGSANNDCVFYDGNFADYTFDTSTWFHGGRGVEVQQLIVTDHASGGADGNYEGRDRLLDIDYLVFADQTVAVDDLL